MRVETLERHLQERVLILDGAMGTMVQQACLSACDFGGTQTEGCNEILNLTRPALIESIHRAYLEAGADIIETNTFGASSVVLAEYGCAEQDREINRRAALLARQAADDFSTTEKPRFVAGSIGPTIELLGLSAQVSFD